MWNPYSVIKPFRERLRRHPFGVEAFFKRSLVLTYAVRPAALSDLLCPGLEVDDYCGWGFVAIALVETRNLRPQGFPTWLGRDFFLSGYRIFTRLRRPGRVALRGLCILRSDTDRRSMSILGNAFTRYGYSLAQVQSDDENGQWSVKVHTPSHEADLDVVAKLAGMPARLPASSPFESMEDARQFAGPLPFTFSYDDYAQKIVVVKGVRKHWNLQPVTVDVRTATFLDSPRFAVSDVRLANAFYLQDVPYAWKPGYLQATS